MADNGNKRFGIHDPTNPGEQTRAEEMANASPEEKEIVGKIADTFHSLQAHLTDKGDVDGAMLLMQIKTLIMLGQIEHARRVTKGTRATVANDFPI